MKAILCLVVMFFCLMPLRAQETDPFADLPVNLNLEWGSESSYGKFEIQIFNFRVTHNGGFFSQVDMDWAVLSPGVECLDDNWWAGITAKYENPPSERSGLIGSTAEPALMFFQLHHRQRKAEGRVYIPMAFVIDGIKLKPWIELERLTLVDLGKNTTVYFAGQYELGDKPEFDLGLCQKIGPFKLKAYTDLLKPGTDFGLSVGFSTTINR